MKANALRGKLLEFLKSMYPEGADKRTIVSIFYQYHHVDAIIEALEYLSDKKYLLKKEVAHPYTEKEKICWYKILPEGIDLFDGNITQDPGIVIPRG